MSDWQTDSKPGGKHEDNILYSWLNDNNLLFKMMEDDSCYRFIRVDENMKPYRDENGRPVYYVLEK